MMNISLLTSIEAEQIQKPFVLLQNEKAISQKEWNTFNSCPSVIAIYGHIYWGYLAQATIDFSPSIKE